MPKQYWTLDTNGLREVGLLLRLYFDGLALSCLTQLSCVAPPETALFTMYLQQTESEDTAVSKRNFRKGKKQKI
ncbi:hypothetical protein [Nostoc sp.]|uniref:hypothetical protein n=1 Tax=Nostoc sp. TaxID=1180 RepID=UPI002FF6F231